MVGRSNGIVIKPTKFYNWFNSSVSDLEIGELAMNVSDGKFYTKANANTIKEIGGASASIFNQYYKQEILQLLI